MMPFERESGSCEASVGPAREGARETRLSQAGARTRVSFHGGRFRRSDAMPPSLGVLVVRRPAGVTSGHSDRPGARP